MQQQQLPTGAHVFTGTEQYVVEDPAERYQRKPAGSADQGYRED